MNVVGFPNTSLVAKYHSGHVVDIAVDTPSQTDFSYGEFIAVVGYTVQSVNYINTIIV